MFGVGKHYKKGDPLRGAAILLLICETKGLPERSVRSLMQGSFADLGVEEAEVRAYLKKHREELLEAVKKQECL